MKKYDAWREGEVKRLGLPAQLKAETLADQKTAQPFVDVVNTETGQPERYREEVAEVYKRRGKVESRKLIFSVPALPWKK